MKFSTSCKRAVYLLSAVTLTLLTACVDDDADKQAPTLELSDTTIAFSGNSTEDATISVQSNRQWSVAYEDAETQTEWMYYRVTGEEVSPGVYNGNGTVKITVGESTEGRMGRLVFTLSNTYGELYRKYLTITQGDYTPPTVGAVGTLVEWILSESKFSSATGSSSAVSLGYSESTIEAVILANDAAGNNNRKLYVGDNNGLSKSAIVLYDANFAMANDPATNYPVGRKVTLNLENAQYYTFNNVRQLTGVTVTVSDESVDLVVPTVSVEKFNTGDYQAEYVKISNVTPDASWVGKSWTASDAQSVTLSDLSGNTLTVYMNKSSYATGFADLYIGDVTGAIYGVAETYRENPQLIPTNKNDVAELCGSEGGTTDPTEPTTPTGNSIYNETFGTTTVSSPYPLVSSYTGFETSGSGISDVTYTCDGNVSVRASGKLSAGYTGASGSNKAFFGTNSPVLYINKITPGSVKSMQLTFGGAYSKSNSGTYDNTFYSDQFHVALSANGSSWTEVSYTTTNADDYWVLASTTFTLKNAVEKLYIRFSADDTSVFAIDDITLSETSESGTEIELDEGTTEVTPAETTPITIAELLTMATTTKQVVDASANRTLDAVVTIDKDGGNTTTNTLWVMTEGATTSKNGIMLYSSSAYTNPANDEFPFKSGDKVRFTLTSNQAQIYTYETSGATELTCESSNNATWLTYEKLGTSTITPIELTSVDNLSDYLGQVVTIKNAVASATTAEWTTSTAAGNHTFTVGDTSLTVYVQKAAAGFSGKSIKASATGDITGYVTIYKKVPQLCPRNLNDVTAFSEDTTTGGGDSGDNSGDNGTPSETSTGDLISSAADIKAGKYVILFNHSDSGLYYYLPSSEAKTKNPVATEVTITDGKLEGSVTDAMTWTFTGDNTTGFVVSQNGMYLTSTNTAQGIVTTTTASEQTWNFVDNDTYGLLMQSSAVTTARFLSVYYTSTAATWRYYNTGDSYKGKLYLLAVE